MRHRVYAKGAQALKVRAKQVSTLVNIAYVQMPWLRPEHKPLVCRWAEFEIIIRCAFAGIAQHGLFGTDPQDIGVKRLVHDYRQLVQTQTVIERELLMTPSARTQISGDGKEQLDLVALLAQQPEPEEADAGNQSDDPAPGSKLPE